jgi:hypothetical protein
MTTQNNLGETVRGFEVIVARPGKINLRYPAQHHPLLTGQEAIQTMKELIRRGFKCIARTESWGNIEDLTLAEMEEVII